LHSKPGDDAGLRGAITLSLPSRLPEVGLAGTAVRAICAGAGLDEEGAHGMELAVVELLNNIIIHGHARAEGFIIQVEVDAGAEVVRVRIRDFGAPVPDAALIQDFAFDPADMGALPESGMGLMLVRASVDELDYRAGPDGNTMTLTKRIGRRG
jgi:serine/threonine-protein kinase RsbW